jgi:integrase
VSRPPSRPLELLRDSITVIERVSDASATILKGFFEWATLSGRLHGDPARPLRPPKKRAVERTTFSLDQERAILAQNDRRDGLALHLLLKVGIRKGALRGVQFRPFDHAQKRLTILGHSSISTTGDIYTDWDIDQLTETLRGMLDEAER